MIFPRTGRGRFVTAGVVAALAISASFWAPAAAQRWNDHQTNTASYKAKNGHWDTITLPNGSAVSAVHAALMQDGKILITAGSGNNASTFAAGSFTTLLYDPQTNTGKTIPTPTDMFCGGQTFLPDGRLLIAGGTQNYEVLGSDVKKVGGVVTIKSYDRSGAGKIIPDNTVLVGSNGQRYVTDTTVSLPAATQHEVPGYGYQTDPATATVFAWAEDEGAEYIDPKPLTFSIPEVPETTTGMMTLKATHMLLAPHQFEGSAYSYIFDPTTETYLKISDLTVKRWYPTLARLTDGSVLAVSGLNGVGQLVDGAHSTEQLDPTTDKWTARTDLSQVFPTYPALFQTTKPDELFYSGSNTGYGTDAINAHLPGFWNVKTNAFTPVTGLRDADMMDSSSSAWIGPVQDQRLVIVGGGPPGDPVTSTKRIDTIDLSKAKPTYTPGPDLAHTTLYPLLVNLPDDSLLITGGSAEYRAEGNSSNHDAAILNPDTMQLTKAASPEIGRTYHSEALLLPDGRVLTLGSNPLYSNAGNTIKAPFEQRLELFTPPYLYHGARPEISTAPATAKLGAKIAITSPQAANIAKVRLVAPSAATHVSNIVQRDVAVDFTVSGSKLNLTLPSSNAILPTGYYMMFATDKSGVPSVAKWIKIG